MANGVRKLTLTIPEESARRLDAMAEVRKIPVSELLRRSVALLDLIDHTMSKNGSVSLVVKKEDGTVADTITNLTRMNA